MKTLSFFIVPIATLLLVACSRRSVKPSIDPGAAPYRHILEAALAEPGGTYSVPLGEVQIVPDSEIDNKEDGAPKLGTNWLGVIEGARRKNLVEFSEELVRNSSPDRSQGIRKLFIKPTARLLALADKKKAKPGMVQVTIFRAEITEITQDIPYTGRLAKPHDDYRLVIGKYRWTPTSECQELYSALAPTVDARFRAVLKIDPFNHSYSVVGYDSGPIDPESWTSSNVE